MLTNNELIHNISTNKLRIGSHYIKHKDHIRIIYYDEDAKYLGDTISLNMHVEEMSLVNSPIPIFSKKEKGSSFDVLRKMLKKILSDSQVICIVGPSLAGKTSLVKYLENGIPLSYLQKFEQPVTMGKSVKHTKLGNINLKIFDMGGQRDFWSQWEDAIHQSQKIIFVADGVANNIKEIKEAFQLILDFRGDRDVPILFLINKFDLFVDGYSNNFLRVEEITQDIALSTSSNIWVLETSIFNGLSYNYGGIQQENPLSQIIIDFLDIK